MALSVWGGGIGWAYRCVCMHVCARAYMHMHVCLIPWEVSLIQAVVDEQASSKCKYLNHNDIMKRLYLTVLRQEIHAQHHQ